MTIPQRASRGYNRLDANETNPLDEPLTTTVSTTSISTISTTEETTELAQSSNPSQTTSCQSASETGATEIKTIPEGYIEVIVLDTLHHRFRIAVDPEWTVEEFKTHAAAIHHVPAASQRLIHMGKLLQDDKILRDYGINDNETIVHLFPKPTVVITDTAASSNQNENQQTNATTTDDDANRGAHVPQIILDAEEARRTNSMVIFSSTEMFEAQHRVKLLSFLLLVISSMELLTLVTLMLGVPEGSGVDDDVIPPGDPTDSPYNANQMQMRQWRQSDYADLAISSLGFYVATLGIKATAENTLVSAKRYYAGLLVVGCAWVGYYYYLGYDHAKSVLQDQQDDEDGDVNKNANGVNLYTQAAGTVILPICVWSICFLRAYQFQSLIGEAEREGQARMEILTREMQSNEDNSDELGLREDNITANGIV